MPETLRQFGSKIRGPTRLTLAPFEDLTLALRQKYGKPKQAAPDTLAALFRLYPHPGLIEDLWMLVEDARVEAPGRSCGSTGSPQWAQACWLRPDWAVFL